MAQYTVNEVRIRLGNLMSKVFDEIFTNKYEFIASRAKDNAAEILHYYKDHTDQYATMLSEKIHFKSKVTIINQKADPFVVFTFFMRYHFVTSHFVESNQQQVLDFPESDTAFIQEIFIRYWSGALST